MFEIATSSLIRQYWRNGQCEYFFTEDTNDRCKFIEDGVDEGPLDSDAQWKKVSAIYYQLYEGSDNTFSTRVKDFISLRNKYIHPGKDDRPTITQANFHDLFDVIIEFLSVFK